MKQSKKRGTPRTKSAAKKTSTKPGSRISSGSKAASNHYAKISHGRKVKKDAKRRRKAEYLATLPKSRIKRTFYRLHPRRLYKYWFSKDGVIMALKITGVSFALVFLFSLSVFAYFRRDLPNPRDINSRLLAQSTKFYDRTGETLLYEVYGDENRTVVEFDEISDAAKHATVALEDKDFYEHGGVSFSGIARAAWSNLTTGDATGQGGSTITQQFIKNSLLTVDQTYTRKVQEIILALELERLYSKDEILSFYLNEIPYGPQEYGIEAAAQSFFSKSADELDVAEAAMLASLPQAPTYFSPYGDHTDELIIRQEATIELMYQQGYITREEADEAIKVDVLARVTPLSERSLYTNILAPHFVIEVQSQLEELYTAPVVRNAGYKVITTLDLELQKIAEKAVTDADNGGFCDNNGACGDNAAIVASDVDTGQILAMVGSRRFTYPEYGSFNAALADRQPGSSFKPYEYAQLFYNERWGPDSFIYDTPTTWGTYRPRNFDNGYAGQMLVREALGESRNIPAVKAMDIASPEASVGLAIAMGNPSLADDAVFPAFDLSYALGAGEVKLAEHTHAYGTFARGGKYVDQSYILRIETADGEVLDEWQEDEGEQVLDEQVAYLITDILTDDAARAGTFGLGNTNLVVPGLNHAVKTGSTDESVDGLMMGYSAHLTVGVWVGNHDNTPMDSFTSQQTGPIFTQFLKEATDKKDYAYDAVIQERPSGIQSVKMSRQTGFAADDSVRQTYTGLFPSWYEPEFQDDKSTYVIDTVSNKLATDCTPERAREERRGLSKWPEVLPGDYRYASWSRTAGYGGGVAGPEEKDDVHSCDDELPDISLNVNDLGGGVYEFEAQAGRGTFPLETLNFKVDGQIVSTRTVANNGGTYTYEHTFSKNGQQTVAVEIIDEGLYDNTNSRSVNVSGAGGGGGESFSITSHSNGESDVETDDVIEWSNLSGPGDYFFCYKENSAPSFACLNNGNSRSYNGNLFLTNSTTYNLKVEVRTGATTRAETSVITITTED